MEFIEVGIKIIKLCQMLGNVILYNYCLISNLKANNFTLISTLSCSWMASTQFQATSARFAFPCYDEPSFKARFDIIIRRPVSFRSWSCTNIRETVPSPTV